MAVARLPRARMLYHVLGKLAPPGAIVEIDAAAKDVKALLDGLDTWFQTHGLATLQTGEKVFYQGGHVKCDGTFEPAEIDGPKGDPLNFAVNCQTWAVAALGTDRIDKLGGDGTVYNMWKVVKDKAAYLSAREVSPPVNM